MGRQRENMYDRSDPRGYTPQPGPERVILVGVQRPLRDKVAGDHAHFFAEESLNELARLSDTAGLQVTGRVVRAPVPEAKQVHVEIRVPSAARLGCACCVRSAVCRTRRRIRHAHAVQRASHGHGRRGDRLRE